jgi:hypothetical protein
VQPTLDMIRRLTFARTVSEDELIFGKDERGPDEDLRLQFEAINQFDAGGKGLASGLLEGLILKHQAKQSVAHAAARNAPAPARKATAKRAAPAQRRRPIHGAHEVSSTLSGQRVVPQHDNVRTHWD